MIKKILSLIFLSILAISCGKRAQAKEFINIPLQASSCGDSKLGTWICNASNISVTDYLTDLKNNNFININAGNFDEFLTGPLIDLSSGNFKIITAQVDIEFMVSPTSISNCNSYNQFQPLFKIQLIDQNKNIISEENSSVFKAELYPFDGGSCSLYSKSSISIHENFPSQYNLVRVRAINLNSGVRTIPRIQVVKVRVYTSANEEKTLQ